MARSWPPTRAAWLVAASLLVPALARCVTGPVAAEPPRTAPAAAPQSTPSAARAASPERGTEQAVARHGAAPATPAPADSIAISAPGTAAKGVPSAADPGDGARVQVVERAMGTRVTLAAYADATHSSAAIAEALASALGEIRRIEALMSPHRPESDVSRVNAAAGREAIGVSPETLAVIDKSLWMAEQSGGVFDITFASMGPLWRFSPAVDAVLPSPAAVAEARRRVDFRSVRLDRAAHTVRLRRADTRIDLGGVAKGYAVDRAAAVLRQAGLRDFFAQAGGDLYVAGRKPGGERWRVGARDPRGPEEAFFAIVPVEDHAFSTAGDYERSFFAEGKRYHHIIDPRTGYPATASRSVSVWALDALTADLVDDAVFILGPERGLALVESIDGCGAIVVDANNRVWISKRLEGVAQIVRPPTDAP